MENGGKKRFAFIILFSVILFSFQLLLLYNTNMCIVTFTVFTVLLYKHKKVKLHLEELAPTSPAATVCSTGNHSNRDPSSD